MASEVDISQRNRLKNATQTEYGQGWFRYDAKECDLALGSVDALWRLRDRLLDGGSPRIYWIRNLHKKEKLQADRDEENWGENFEARQDEP